MQIQRADRRLRLATLAVLLMIVLFGAIGVHWLEGRLAEVQRFPAEAALEEVRLWLTSVVSAAALGLAGLSAYLWRLGSRIRTARRFPPPGMRILRDTAVLVDAAADRRGKLAQAFGVGLLACDAGLLVVSWRLYSLLSPQAG